MSHGQTVSWPFCKISSKVHFELWFFNWSSFGSYVSYNNVVVVEFSICITRQAILTVA